MDDAQTAAADLAAAITAAARIVWREVNTRWKQAMPDSDQSEFLDEFMLSLQMAFPDAVQAEMDAPMTPAQTAAADLAAAVVEFGERLPGWWWQVGANARYSFADCRQSSSADPLGAKAATPAAALRAVMQQALQSMRPSGVEGVSIGRMARLIENVRLAEEQQDAEVRARRALDARGERG